MSKLSGKLRDGYCSMKDVLIPAADELDQLRAENDSLRNKINGNDFFNTNAHLDAELSVARSDNLAFALQVKVLKEALSTVLSGIVIGGISTDNRATGEKALSVASNSTAIISEHDAEVRTEVIEEIKTIMNNTPWLQWGEKLENMK